MSELFDVIRQAVADGLDFAMDSFTVTVDPQGDNIAYECRGFVDNDHERHRERGLTIGTGQRVIVLLQAQSPTLTDISAGDRINGPTNATHRSAVLSTVKDVTRDPADATWAVAVAP